MADDHILHPEVNEHIRTDLAGEGAGLFEVDVLGADMDVGARALGNGDSQVGGRHADDNFAAGALNLRDQIIQQQPGLGRGFVHLPVAGNDGFAVLFIHSV